MSNRHATPTVHAKGLTCRTKDFGYCKSDPPGLNKPIVHINGVEAAEPILLCLHPVSPLSIFITAVSVNYLFSGMLED